MNRLFYSAFQALPIVTRDTIDATTMNQSGQPMRHKPAQRLALRSKIFSAWALTPILIAAVIFLWLLTTTTGMPGLLPVSNLPVQRGSGPDSSTSLGSEGRSFRSVNELIDTSDLIV